jgi:hypothetical protein
LWGGSSSIRKKIDKIWEKKIVLAF